LLIVNADDLGIDAPTTDAIVECFRSGAITNATAMVWMRDSERAAEVALASSLPVGLHLNLIEPYAGSDVPDGAADRQRRVVDHLRTARSLLYRPRIAHDFDGCIRDQLDQFERLYGRPPTHVDGHRHMHISLNAVFAPSLRGVATYRRAFTFTAAQSPLHKRAGRAVQSALIRTRFATTRYFFSIRTLHPDLGGTGLDDRLSLSRSASVEVMTHPGLADERRALDGDVWRRAIERLPTGSFGDLA
jgi:predicted glycoside hydrolase/deacetylase ChbG (UPF0249 family)